MSTTREMKVQRSTKTRALAVASSIFVALGLCVAAAPASQAKSFCASAGHGVEPAIGPYDTGGKARAAAKAECEKLLGTGGRPADAKITTDVEPKNDGTYKSLAFWSEPDSGNPGTDIEDVVEDVLEPAPAPPPCWSNNNCPVGGAIQVAVPEYMIAGMPQQLIVYASWRPDENTPGAPTNGDAVISMDGEPVAAAAFENGVATFKFTPTVPGLKNVTVSGVLNSNTSGANAWIDSVPGATMVLPYDPALLEEALKNKKVEVGDTYTLEEIAQAKTALGKRLEWRVAQDSSDVCAVTTTKKGEVKAKFTESGKCSIIWTDPKTDEEGKYTFKVTA